MLFYKVTGSVNVRILMKAKYLTAVTILVLLMVAISSETRAQDEVPGPDLNSINTTDPGDYDEKPLLYEPEGRATRTVVSDTVTSRPAIQAQPKKATPASEAKKKEESDPLNFNFLFYIIQTFKSSDLMMEQ
jgi:hypothetical protein